MAEGKKKNHWKSESLPGSFVTGAIALIFLIIGYEVAVFVHKAAVTRIESHRDHPDTVYIVKTVPMGDPRSEPGMTESGKPGMTESGKPGMTGIGESGMTESGEPGMVSALEKYDTVRRNAKHSDVVEKVRQKTRKVETFRFNPNTVSVEDLQRLGFSEKQALSIDNYRLKGGRFRRKADFAKSYVVADSVYDRLEPFIDIPLLDINVADSVALLDLPGIGPYFAGKIVSYRNSLRGYSCKEQLMDIYHFDREKFDSLQDLIKCSEVPGYPIWTLPESELAAHPHISRSEAHAIVIYREHHGVEECTLEGLKKAGVLSEEHAGKLSLCRLSPVR